VARNTCGHFRSHFFLSRQPHFDFQKIHPAESHKLCNHIFLIILSGVRLSPLGTAATTGLFYQLQMIDDGDCGAFGGMKIGRENRSTRRKPAPPPLCVPEIPHG
jgi:hypothetical protein